MQRLGSFEIANDLIDKFGVCKFEEHALFCLVAGVF